MPNIMQDLGTKIGSEFKTHRLRIEAVETNKQENLVSGTNIKTINGTSVLGSGDIVTTQTTISGNAGTATKLQTARNIALTGDVTGNANFDGSGNISITAAIAANSVALGTDTTGNYVAGITAGTGISVTGTAGEGWSPTITLSNVGTAGTYTKITTNAQGQVTSGTSLSDSDIPSLDASKITTGIIDSARLPAFVDDVLEFANLASFPATGESGKIYVALDTNKTYRWSGSVYVYITSGAVDSVNGQTGVVNITTITGNAGTATTLQTARTFQTNLGTTTAGSFNGSANITLGVTGTLPVANGGTGATTLTGLIKGNGTGAMTAATAGTDYVIPSGSISGNAGTATTLQTARTIGTSGDVTGTATSFNGSANITIPMTLANSGVTAGTYSKVTVDAKGRVTAGLTQTMEDIPDATFKRSVKCATTANITLSGTQTIDGIAVVAGDRVLVKEQTTASQNGIYVVSTGAWTRALDADSSSKIASALVAVDSGTLLGGKLFDNDFKTTDTLGTTAMPWSMNLDDGSLLTAGSTSIGMIKYNGTTATAGQFDGGTTTPTGTTRLNFGGYFYPTYINLTGSVDTTTASSHVFVETGSDGYVRPKTLANFKTEIFASPTLVTPNIGVATGTSFNSITGLSSTSPSMNGTAAVGTSATVARADHVHPTDTTKQATLVSGTNIKTINGTSVLGSGDISISGGATLSDDTSTNSTYYPTFAIATSGNMSTAKVSSTKLTFNPSTGTFAATEFNSLSDVNKKENITNITNGLEIINKLNGVEFDWKESGIHSSGVIAQELEKVLPFLVTEIEGTKTVNYLGIIGYLINAVQELSKNKEA